MKTHLTILILLLSSLLFSGCMLEQSQKSVITPTSISTDLTIATISMDCSDHATVESGNHRAENNIWRKSILIGGSQCIGLETDPDGTLQGRWTWDWKNFGGRVIAYPEIILGQKPGSVSTFAGLPKKLSFLSELAISYDIESTHTGSGNAAFEIWLTDTQNPSTWGVPPITHEIMIWLDYYGDLSQPAGTRIEEVTIDGIEYDLYVDKDFGQGWTYIAFARSKPQLGAGTLNLTSFFSYLKSKGSVTGNEYLASVEFGNEIVSGTGETILHKYSVSVH